MNNEALNDFAADAEKAMLSIGSVNENLPPEEIIKIRAIAANWGPVKHDLLVKLLNLIFYGPEKKTLDAWAAEIKVFTDLLLPIYQAELFTKEEKTCLKD